MYIKKTKTLLPLEILPAASVTAYVGSFAFSKWKAYSTIE